MDEIKTPAQMMREHLDELNQKIKNRTATLDYMREDVSNIAKEVAALQLAAGAFASCLVELEQRSEA